MTSDKPNDKPPKNNKDREENHDSKTGVHPDRTHGLGVWGNRRVTLTVRVDEGIKIAFIPFARRVFGSVCLPLECLMAGLLGVVDKTSKHGVHPGLTAPLNLKVDKIVIERSVRSRRKMGVKAVEKIRRERGEDVGEAAEPMLDKYIAQDVGVWVRMPLSEGVNPNGHAVGCECTVCKPEWYRRKPGRR